MKCRGRVLLPLLLVVWSCKDFAAETEVAVLCPSPPAAWQVAFPGLAFRIVTRDSLGAVRETDTAAWGVPISVPCARTVNAPILAWPHAPTHAPGSLRPAGGFFPLSLTAIGEKEVVRLTWEDGPAAKIVFRVAAEGRDMSLFNVARLRRFFAEAREPWDLDLDSIAQRIATGELTAWDIDLLPSYPVDLEPGPGTWFLESPFDSPRDAAGGRIILPRCARGVHRLFSLAGPSWRMQVGESGSFLCPDDE